MKRQSLGCQSMKWAFRSFTSAWTNSLNVCVTRFKHVVNEMNINRRRNCNSTDSSDGGKSQWTTRTLQRAHENIGNYNSTWHFTHCKYDIGQHRQWMNFSPVHTSNNVEQHCRMLQVKRHTEHVQFVSNLSKRQNFTINAFDIVAVLVTKSNVASTTGMTSARTRTLLKHATASVTTTSLYSFAWQIVHNRTIHAIFSDVWKLEGFQTTLVT